MKLSLIIPAHNEEKRIARTLHAYADFFITHHIDAEILVVLNACSDNTLEVVLAVQQTYPLIRFLNLKEGGKGYAIKEGFKDALSRANDAIGFVDADMATSPDQFSRLIMSLDRYDGVIASRYMPGSHVYPPRPLIKRWGSKLVYEPLIWLLFGMRYYDYQCGAKLFKRNVLEKIVPELVIRQWAFDVELLYLCKKYGFRIKEIQTEWHDQADSKLRIMKSGMRMLSTLIWLRLYHSPFRKWLTA